jgi:hypothetical protein
LTHTHLDHFDDSARAIIPPATPFLHQPADTDQLTSEGFTALFSVDKAPTRWNGIELVRTEAQHGGQVRDLL